MDSDSAVQAIGDRLQSLGITDLVVWGLKTHTHSHHYIHRGIYDMLEVLGRRFGLTTHWYDDEPISLRRRGWNGRRRTYLIFSAPHYDADAHIPVLPDAYYIAHGDWDHSWPTKSPVTRYDDAVAEGRAVFWRVFREFPAPGSDDPKTVSLPELSFFSPSERRLTMPWATDLLPDAIDRMAASVTDRYRSQQLFPGRRVLFVGSVWARNEEVMGDLERACDEAGLELSVERIDSTADVIAATQNSFMAPAIQGSGHAKSTEQFYVPCRIFKNISYGAIGVTNNPGVSRLFEGKVLFDTDIRALIERYKELVAGFDDTALEAMLQLMWHVRDHHTYISRIGRCLAALNHGDPTLSE